jgi:plasmid stabilization system protein ParE
MRVIWAPRAILRVTEIAEYIAADRPAAARRWVRELFAKAGGCAGTHAWVRRCRNWTGTTCGSYAMGRIASFTVSIRSGWSEPAPV